MTKEGKQSIPASTIRFVDSPWTIQFMTIDQDPETFESANIGGQNIFIYDKMETIVLLDGHRK